jgi:hypothetical protein
MAGSRKTTGKSEAAAPASGRAGKAKPAVGKKPTAGKKPTVGKKDDGVLFRAPNGKLYRIPGDKLAAFEVDNRTQQQIAAKPDDFLDLQPLLGQGPGIWPLKK